jgi:predicted Holliday junction resolvase-like endonuclease
MSTIHQRILTIIDEQNLSIASFERKIDVGRNSISMAIRKKSAIDHNVLKKINEKFPTYSFGWIITGKSEVDRESSAEFSRDVMLLFKKWKDKI